MTIEGDKAAQRLVQLFPIPQPVQPQAADARRAWPPAPRPAVRGSGLPGRPCGVRAVAWGPGAGLDHLRLSCRTLKWCQSVAFERPSSSRTRSSSPTASLPPPDGVGRSRRVEERRRARTLRGASSGWWTPSSARYWGPSGRVTDECLRASDGSGGAGGEDHRHARFVTGASTTSSSRCEPPG